MDKYFICLANSLKRGGRCIAGIEINVDEQDCWSVVRNTNGAPRWIRPIDPCTEYGEITNLSASLITLFSVVRLMNVQEVPCESHVEDTLFSQMTVIGDIMPTISILKELTDNVHLSIFYDSGNSISKSTFAEGTYSLMFICAEAIHIVPDLQKERTKYRMQIKYKGNDYDMPITDPDYLNYLSNNMKDGGCLRNIYLCISLGMEYEGRHHKLVAGVITPRYSVVQTSFTFTRRKISMWKEIEARPLMWRERLAIKSSLYMPSYKGHCVYLRKWNGEEQFIALEGDRELAAMSQIPLSQMLYVTYKNEDGQTTCAFRWKNAYGK